MTIVLPHGVLFRGGEEGIIRKNLVEKNNIDAIIIAEAPKCSPYIDEMRRNIANTLDISTGAVSIKATTEEGLGFTGKGEGIAASAVAVIDE